ncbi:uncharacterized protein [Parasteatoda tepidariorum]|uniref:uncharacterized protein n=1 Tax=Parasteatoda tepidariorum TaxID=114398 RepID=UPI0039BD2236
MNCDGPTVGWEIRKRKGHSIVHGTPSKKFCGPIWCLNRFTECWDDLMFGIDPNFNGMKGNNRVGVNEVYHQKQRAIVFKYRIETPINIFEMEETSATYSETTTIVENCNPTECSLEQCLKQSMTLIKIQENATHDPIRYVNESTSIFANIPKTNLGLFSMSFRKTLIVDMADTSFVTWYFEFLKDSCCVPTCRNSMQKPCHTNFELFSMSFRKTLFVDMTEVSLVMWCFEILKDRYSMQTCQDMSNVRSEALSEMTLTYAPEGSHVIAKKELVCYRNSVFSNCFGVARLNHFLNISNSFECRQLFELVHKKALFQNAQFQIERVWNGYFSVFCVNSNWYTTNKLILKFGTSKSSIFAEGSFNRDVSFHRAEITQTRKKNMFLQSGRENVSKMAMIGVRFRHRKRDNANLKQKQNHKSELCCDLDKKYLSHKSITYNREIRKSENRKFLDKKPVLKIKEEKKNGFDMNYEEHNENVGILKGAFDKNDNILNGGSHENESIPNRGFHNNDCSTIGRFHDEIDHSLNVISEDASTQNNVYYHSTKRESEKRDIGCPKTSYLPSNDAPKVKKSKKGFLKKIFKRSSHAIKERNNIQLDEQMKTPKSCDEVIREVDKPKKIKNAKKKEVSPTDGRIATTGCCDDTLNCTFDPKKAKKVWKFKVPKWLKGKKKYEKTSIRRSFI